MNAKETIENYLAEMLEWETNFYKFMRTPEYKSNENNCRVDGLIRARTILSGIINKYVSDSAIGTLGQAALDTMAVGNPPRYQQVFNSAEEKAKSAKVIFESKNGGLIMKFCKYSLILSEGEWKIKEIHASIDQVSWTKRKGL